MSSILIILISVSRIRTYPFITSFPTKRSSVARAFRLLYVGVPMIPYLRMSLGSAEETEKSETTH